MARGKNAPALFEVIRNAQEKQRQQEQRLREQRLRDDSAKTAGGSSPAASASTGTPAVNKLKSSLDWLKSKSASAAAGMASKPAMREASEGPNVEVKSPVTARLKSGEDVAASAMAYEEAERVEVPLADQPPAAPAQAAPPYRPAMADLARQMREEIAAGNEADRGPDRAAPAAEPFFDSRPAHSYSPSDESGDASSYPSAGPEFAIDRDNRQISLRVSYNSAIIAGFAVVVALGLAYVIGSAGRSKTTTVAESNPQPGVLEVQPESTGGSSSSQTKTPSSEGMANINSDNNLGVENVSGGPVAVPKNFKRVVNLNYVVLMSSPSTRQLQDLVKFLADHGVPATVEQLPGFSRKTTWYSVVTTKGFDRVSNNPQLDVFLARLNQLMQQYSKTSSVVPGKPALFMWKSPSA